MKSVLVFALFAIVALVHADDDDEELRGRIAEVNKECAAKTNFSEEGIKKLEAQDSSITENIQCFQKCFYETIGFVRDLSLDHERILEVSRLYNEDENTVRVKFENCSPLYRPDAFDCDAAWELYKCFH